MAKKNTINVDGVDYTFTGEQWEREPDPITQFILWAMEADQIIVGDDRFDLVNNEDKIELIWDFEVGFCLRITGKEFAHTLRRLTRDGSGFQFLPSEDDLWINIKRTVVEEDMIWLRKA